jgi:Clp amino terminal domain, pathogenicity island component
MFERFTDRARRVLVLAQEEARLLNHSFIGTEHLLLGLIREEDGVAATALSEMGVTLEAVRARVKEAIGQTSRPAMTGSPPFTPRAKKVLELSLRQALQLGHSYIGTEHILLGLIQEGEGVAIQVLIDLRVNLLKLQEQVVRLMVGQDVEAPAIPGRDSGWRSVALQRGYIGARPMPGRLMMPGPHLTNVCLLCGRDLWEVGHYVTNGAANICEVCITDSATLVGNAPPDERSLTLPPRVFGEVPDPSAVGDIVLAATKVFEGRSDDELPLYLEEADALRPFMQQARQRVATQDITVVVRRVRFDSAEAAEVELTIRVGEGGLQVGVEGPMQKFEGRWMVTRELMADIVGRAGVRVPPGD